MSIPPISRRALAPVSYESSQTVTGANAQPMVTVGVQAISRMALATVSKLATVLTTGANALRLIRAVILEEMESLDAEAAEVLETIRGLV